MHIFAAINCTEAPFNVHQNDLGMSNWTGVDGVDPRPYATAIKYFCRRLGWGYPSNGLNETVVYCQNDGTWSNEVNIETCMSKYIAIIYLNKRLNFDIQSFHVQTSHHQL